MHRISVKREQAPAGRPVVPPGRISSYLHDHIREGDTLHALMPRGDFVLDEASPRGVVLISAGVGITPMLSMVDHLAETNPGRPTWFLHGARNGAEMAFGAFLHELAGRRPRLTTHTCFSRPSRSDVLGRDFDHRGRLDAERVIRLLPHLDMDFYICGPSTFTDQMIAGLREAGVAGERIRTERFGPGAPSSPVEEKQREQAEVTFAVTGKKVTWSPDSGSLLDLAESAGLELPFSCRSGSCHACIQKVGAGEVGYDVELPRKPDSGFALLCQAKPEGPVTLEV